LRQVAGAMGKAAFDSRGKGSDKEVVSHQL